MRWVCGVLGVVAGCSFNGPNNAGELIDAASGTDGLQRTCEWGFDPIHFDPCDLTFVDPPELEAGRTYLLDTDDQTIVTGNEFTRINIDDEGQGDGVVVAIWAVTGLDFGGASLRVIGSRSLMIVSDRDLIIRGDIDASGITGEQAGGADHVTACVGSSGGSGDDGGGAGGGGGGGAVTTGAVGQSSIGGAGGGSGQSFGLLTVRGGCQGGAGGAVGGAGGRGGGAVYLAARDLVRIDALINVGGGGGEPGEAIAATAGGGGGGAGGQISVEASQVDLSSVTRLIANGGGGGGGSSSSGTIGTAGSAAPLDGTQASGGAGGAIGGGAGGLGAADVLSATTTVGTASGGGGGGGGGRGRISIRAGTLDNNAATISPAPAYSTF